MIMMMNAMINVLLIRMSKRRPMCPLLSKLAVHETNSQQKVSMRPNNAMFDIQVHCRTSWAKQYKASLYMSTFASMS